MFLNATLSVPSPPAGTLPEDAALVAGLHAGDPRAVEQMVAQYGPALYRFAYYQLQDAMLAEDLVAEVFARVIEKVGGYVQDSTPFQAWLFRIARNLVTDHYRSVKRRPQTSFEQWLAAEPAAEPGGYDSAIDGLPMREELLAGLRLLTEEQRQVIILHVLEGWEMPQVAQILGRSLPSVKSLYYRGMDSLRRVLTAPPAKAPRPTTSAPAPRPVRGSVGGLLVTGAT
jgi:RNA polymerase sigma-70 factor (ECF subfamily)